MTGAPLIAFNTAAQRSVVAELRWWLPVSFGTFANAPSPSVRALPTIRRPNGQG